MVLHNILMIYFFENFPIQIWTQINLKMGKKKSPTFCENLKNLPKKNFITIFQDFDLYKSAEKLGVIWQY